MAEERFIPLRLPPGVFRNGTKYQAKGRWYDANLVRWYEGIMGPIGGWRTVKNAAQADLTISGKPRAVHAWRDNAKVSFLAIGTNTKLYKYADQVITDITPGGLGTGAADGSYVAGNYGNGTYGGGYFGTGSGALTLFHPDTWQLDNFGQDLVACLTSDGRIFEASPTGGAATALADTGNGAPPANNTGIVVTPERFLVALGAGGNARKVQWASQETKTIWTAAEENSAGAFELTTKGRLLCGRRTRRQTMLWTDTDLYAMTFIGGSGVYAFEQLGDNCGIISPNAVAVLGDLAYWMSYGKFFIYDGALKPIPCDVADFVFSDLSVVQRAKISAVANTLYDEIVWFYPSALQTGSENDRYVAYNYREGHWSIGTMGRGCGADRGAFDFPIYVGTDGFIYEHEIGNLRTGAGTVYAESGPIEIGEGDVVARAQRFIPDEKTLGDVQMKFFTALYPTAAETTVGPISAANPTSVRFTGRQIRVRCEEVRAAPWRFGVPRLAVMPGGGR